MFKGMKTYLQEELRSIEEAGLYKRERIIITPQNADIKVGQGQEVVNFCANNYLHRSSQTCDGHTRLRYEQCTLHLRYTRYSQSS